ncbi:MAG: S-layer homology domain-containing protein, partial [Clostridia bacterium]|nr:S-layer homology domain-containing protein [Clostridia bacterium]
MKLTKILSAVLAVLMLFSAGLIGVTAEENLPFTDVPAGEWYYDAVAYTYGMGLMNGTGDGTKFSPSMNLTRGMVVTVLYRNYGAPEVHFLNPFADVKEDAYYGAAAVWAYHSKVVTGTGEDEWGDPLFSPDRNITRQELATMIGRYAAFCHVDTTKNTADIAVFPDSGKVASWAADTVKWAAGTGIITGKGTGSSATLSPEDLATRAEFATIIKRFNDKDDAREFTYKLAYTEPMPISKFTEKDYPLVTDADVYVAVDGNDNNPGTEAKPLASFEAAKAKVREIKKTKTSGEIKVAFKGGNYGGLDNLTFTPEDSGSDKLSIVYCAYGDGDVVFQNGVVIKENEFTLVDGDEKSMFPKKSRDHVYKVDLTGRVDT